MSRFRSTLAAFVGVTITLASLLAVTAPAFGQRPPDNDAGPTAVPVQQPVQQPVQLHTITQGSPVWVFVLVALAAAAVSAAVVLAALKLRRSTRLSITHA